MINIVLMSKQATYIQRNDDKIEKQAFIQPTSKQGLSRGPVGMPSPGEVTGVLTAMTEY